MGLLEEGRAEDYNPENYKEELSKVIDESRGFILMGVTDEDEGTTSNDVMFHDISVRDIFFMVQVLIEKLKEEGVPEEHIKIILLESILGRG